VLTAEEIRPKLTELLVRIADTPPEAIKDTAALKELGIDSVAIVELAEGIATTFDVRLSDQTVNEWLTVGDVIRSVRRGDSFLASLPPPELNDPEQVGAFKQLAIVGALVGAGIGVLIGVAFAALIISSGFGGGSLPPITAPDDTPTPQATGSTPTDPFGDADREPTPTSTAPTGASLTVDPDLVDAGEDFRLTGQLPGTEPGEQLIIEWREDGGAWEPFPVSANANPDGTFGTRIFLASQGEREFRVRTEDGTATPPVTVRIS
jgi:acyl carrier protein